MRRNELIFLRSELEREKEKRKEYNDLLKNGEIGRSSIIVEGLVEQWNLDINSLIFEPRTMDEYQILEYILRRYNITGTNGIYVCTNACYTTCDICYEETTWYSEDLLINDPSAEYKLYMDIESKEVIKAYSKKKLEEYKDRFTGSFFTSAILISEFEGENIVLNPHNNHQNENGFAEVRKDFLLSAIHGGQAKAKKLVLSKYPRM